MISDDAFTIDEQTKKYIENHNIQNNVSLKKYESEVNEQNVKLLNEMEKEVTNSKNYKMKQLQYKTNLLFLEINKKCGNVLVKQELNN